MAEIKLRSYQQKFIDDVRNQFIQNYRRVVGVAPCGAGKTIMTGWMIRESARRGKRSIFFVHRQELIKQTSETFTRLNIPHGIIASGVPMKTDLPVQIASVQTLVNRLDKIPAPDFLICDECHHILANTYKKVLKAYPNAFLLGVTATPQRMGGQTLDDVFDRMVLAPSVNQLIKLGNLPQFKYYAAPLNIDLDGVRVQNGDFKNNDLFKKMSSKKITGDIVQHYLDFASGKSAICYCVNVEHSMTVADAFYEAGVSAVHIDADTPKKQREQLVADFRNNKIKILCNAELFGEGFDVPHCQAVILARPTKSLTLYIQQAMRPMRLDPADPSKVAIIIDCVQNRERHGLPNDWHDWSLDPNTPLSHPCPSCGKFMIRTTFTKKDGEPLRFEIKDGSFFLKNSYDKSGEPVKLAIDFIAKTNEPIRVAEDPLDGRFMKICPECGYLFLPQDATKTASKRAKYQQGKLNLVDVSFADNTSNVTNIINKPKTIEELLLVAKKKNYHPAWAAFQALYYVNSFEDCLHIANVCGYKQGWAWYKWQELQDRFSSDNILPNAQSV